MSSTQSRNTKVNTRRSKRKAKRRPSSPIPATTGTHDTCDLSYFIYNH